MQKNIITLSDSYKFGHNKMYPVGTEAVYSYFEARKGAKYDETTFFGLQSIILKYLQGQVVTRERIERAATIASAHFGNEDSFNRKGWEYILDKCDGRLPVRIKAVPEGMSIPINNVMMTVENTHKEAFFLTNFLESLLTHVWYGSTVATLSRHVKKSCMRFLEQTSDNPDAINFMLHDFGFRGVSSVESAEVGGAAHLINFLGTDTVVALEFIMDNYFTTDMAGFSVNATEHSVMTAKAKEGEEDVVKSIIEAYPTGILSMVCDSYDDENFARNIIGDKFKQAVLARDGKFVLRPDSGDPVPTMLKLINILGEKFGVSTNSKGFKVLHPKIGIIWGDGIDADGIDEILEALKKDGWSACNAVFGMGGGLLQKVNRDTQRFAFKSSAQKRDGIWHDVYKSPKDQSKASKKGRLKLVWNEGSHGKVLTTVAEGDPRDDVLETVFENGMLVSAWAFEGVRDNAKVTQ